MRAGASATVFRYPSYVQDIMGSVTAFLASVTSTNYLHSSLLFFCSDLFSLGFGPFRYIVNTIY